MKTIIRREAKDGERKNRVRLYKNCRMKTAVFYLWYNNLYEVRNLKKIINKINSDF